MKALVVVSDRNKEVRETFFQILSRDGHDVIRASNGALALQIIEENKDIRLVIVELNIGGQIDGMMVAKKIKKIIKSSTIILTSGSFEQNTLDQAEQFGIVALDKTLVNKFLIDNVLVKN